MKSPSPLFGLLAALGWAGAAAVATPLLLPPSPAYRTAVVGAAVLLFVLALVARRAAFILAILVATTAGVSGLVAGFAEPSTAAPVPLFAYFAGAAIRGLYEAIEERAANGGEGESPALLVLFRAVLAASLVSAAAAWVLARTSYLLSHGVPPPRTVNVLGTDVQQAVTGIAAALASLAVACGLYRIAARFWRTPRGRRAVDLALVLAALAAGGAALAQKLGALPAWRAVRWQEWGRAQSTFTDPSAAGVAAALLVVPLLARAVAGPALLRVSAAAGFVLLLPVVADAGSRAGLIGTLTGASLFVLWGVTRLAAGSRPGLRRRVVAAVGGLALLFAAAFAASVAWPTRGSVRSALLSRLEGSFARTPTPAETTSERLLLYESALQLFRDHPVVGQGFGSFRFEYPNVARDALGRTARFTDHPPSFYLGTLAEMGVAGAALYALLFLGLARGIGRALQFDEGRREEALRSAGAASALVGLVVVLLFGSHLVYPEIAAYAGVLVARLPFPKEGRTPRFLSAVAPVVVAGVLVLLLGGVLARAVETWTPEAAFRFGRSAGVYAPEAEPDGRPFRWTSEAAAWRLAAPAGVRAEAAAALPVKSARPDGRSVALDVFVDDVYRGRVALPHGRWMRMTLALKTPATLRLLPTATFRPPRGTDARLLGVETGDPVVTPAPRR